MENEPREHQRIRFRRNEIADLGALPSAAPPQVPVSSQPKRRKRRYLHGIGVFFSLAIGLFLAAVFFLAVYGIPSIGMDRLREQAERTGSRFAGEPVVASLGKLGVSFDASRFLSLSLADLKLGAVNPGGPQISAGEVRFGLAPLQLLKGRIQIGNATLADARIVAGALQQNGEQDWAAGLKNAQGLVDPDKVLAAIFDGLHRAFNGLDAGQTRRLALENVEIVLPGLEKTTTFVIRSATLARAGDALTINAELAVNGRTIVLAGNAARPGGTQISSLTVALDSDPIVRDDPFIDDGIAVVDPSLGTIAMDIDGREGVNGEPSTLAASASMTDAAIDLGKNGIIAGDAELGMEFRSGSGELAIKKAAVQTGETILSFSGGIGPQPAEPGAPNSARAYRFELVSDESRLAAQDLADAPVEITSRLAGKYLPDPTELVIDDLKVGTDDGQFAGQGEIIFDGRRAPGFRAILGTTSMPVASAKQLWPFIVAPQAREWVHENVTAGRLVESEINLSLAPGRLGDGIPFTAKEANGRFVVENTSLHVLDTLPIVQDAAGVITFGGNDVEIALSKGEARMAEDRKVTITDGTMRIPGNQDGGPVGFMTLDLSGDAKAIGDLAAREPINAMRFIGMEPNDLSGEIWGTVNADIPLNREVDRSRVHWSVDLAFDKLNLAKPFSGQTVTDAAGTASIDQRRAEIAANANLNGIPARLNLTEPVGSAADVTRKRSIQLTLDEATRQKHFPALDPLISGPMLLDVDAAQGDQQEVSADLTGTEVRVPWVGWQKGAGVPAKLRFRLSARDGVTDLTNFQLSGDSFDVAGDLRLNSGGLASAKLGTVKLNRGDDASIDLERKGKTYTVRVRGKQFDARSLVKHYLAESAASASGTGEAMPVALDVTVDQANGFFNEVINNLKVTYDSGAGALRLSGVMGSGGAVAVQTDNAGGSNALRVQSTDAGGVLRFADVYEHMYGGRIELELAGRTGAAMVGAVDARDFRIVNEPKLRSLVASPPPEGKSLNDTLNREIDTSSVAFERGFTRIQKGPGSLVLREGVVRGPVIGASFQGTFYDPQGNMDMTGTFLPAYGVNRIFGEIPIIGQILGNGRDGALIGITFRLVGNAKKPDLQINPISVIAPGIFRSIFEF
ncbi:hypothetical protein JYU29_07930 [Tianweitania sp. BSSL-BM11]|uniref:YhdP central domain-containing protein n=1 Tax=Tianweitania aestuarii TaxID=2814886 RepID=A0ABS5RY65_9HYPH|nr:DUF3971 domain-containing protein [Tianweitania aestuarii]MBS9720612.1 hypothetical protein [Tianweitania aestuarii]